MAGSLKHTPRDPISKGNYNEDEHIFADGMTGGIATWDALATGKMSFRDRLGLGEATPATAGMIAAQLAANNITGYRVKRFTDVGPTGYFARWQSAAGADLLVVEATYGALVGFKDKGGQIFNVKAYGAVG